MRTERSLSIRRNGVCRCTGFENGSAKLRINLWFAKFFRSFPYIYIFSFRQYAYTYASCAPAHRFLELFLSSLPVVRNRLIYNGGGANALPRSRLRRTDAFGAKKESRKRKNRMSVFFCTSLCAPVCCSPGKAWDGTVLSPRRCACNPTKPRMMPSVATNICISIHFPPCFTSAYLRGARKTASFQQKLPVIDRKLPVFAR